MPQGEMPQIPLKEITQTLQTNKTKEEDHAIQSGDF